MAALETLNEADIKQVVGNSSLKKARGYLSRVSNGVRNGRSLRAEVRGSRLYNVEIDVAQDGIHAVCSCPYTWGGYCKHIGAVLLKWVAQPDSFVIESPAPAAAKSIIETFAIEPPATAVPKEKPFWLQQSYQARCRQNDESLLTWLNEYKLQDLRQMASRQGWTISGNRKADILQQIISQMLQPGIALKSLLSLDAEHRQVYDALGLFYPGIAFHENHLETLAKQWGTLRKHKQIGTYVNHLCEAGLALPSSLGYHYWQQTAFIPGSLLRVLPPLLAERIPAVTLPETADSGVVLGQKRPFLQRLHQVLLMIEHGRPPLRQPLPRPRLEKFHEVLREWDYLPEEIQAAQQSKKFQTHDPDFSFTVPPPLPTLPDGAIERLALIAGDETQLNFIYHLLLSVGLLQPGSPVTVWREVKEQFLRRDEAAQWAILVRAYFALETWSEVWLILAERPSLQLKRAKNGYYRTLRPQQLYEILTVFRGQALQLLASLPDNRWFSLRDVTDLLYPFWARFDSWAWSATRYGMQPDWYLVENGRMLDTTNNKADWNNAQGAFIQQIIQGPLHWLGLADLSFEYGRLAAFRLHGLNDLYFDKVESVPLGGTTELAKDTATSTTDAASALSAGVSPPGPTDAITTHDTTIVVDPTAVSAQTHNYLDGIAILAEAATDRFVYQLHAAAVHQAFEAGQTLSQIVDGWEKWLAIPLPDAIRSQLTAWWEAYGQVRLYENVTIIEFGDEYALAEMKAATSLEKHLVAEISPNLVIIPVNAIDTLVGELEKAGYTPKQTNKVE